MNKIVTDIKPQTKNKKRVNVYLDGEFACGLDLLTVLSNRIKVGMEISGERLKEIVIESEIRSATDVALTFVSKSPKTKKQVEDKLKNYNYDKAVIETAIKKVEEYGYIDDLDYAKRYVSTYKNQKGKLLLKCELIKKGVSQDIIESALNDLESQTYEVKRIAEKYLKGKQIDIKILQKCYKYLLSKGFSYDEVGEVISEIKSNNLE